MVINGWLMMINGLMGVKQCHFYHPWLMVTIPPIKMVSHWGWFMKLFYRHECSVHQILPWNHRIFRVLKLWCTHTHITPWPAIKSFNKNMHYQSLGINHYPYGSPKKDRNIFPGCFVDGVFTIISKFPTWWWG